MTRISDSSITSDALALLAAHDPTHLFLNKIVFVGNSNDHNVQTVAGSRRGTWVLANGLNTMLRQDQGTPRRVLTGFNPGWPIVVALGFARALSVARPIVARTGIVFWLGVAVGLPTVLLAEWRFMPEIITPVITAMASALLAGTHVRLTLPSYVARKRLRLHLRPPL